MAIVANSYVHVIGIDTHARTHTLTIVTAGTGAVEASVSFPATGPGTTRAVAWIGRRIHAINLTLVAVEGIGSYGARIARACREADLRVVEPLPTAKGLRAGRGKSDAIDAELIARSVLACDTTRLREPRTDEGVRAAVRILVASREQLNAHRIATINALTALVRIVDLGIDARRPLTASQIATIHAWRDRSEDVGIATARREARRMARAIRIADDDLTANEHDLTALVAASDAAPLLALPGIGAITAATILTSWSHAGRIHSEAAFAAIAGASPIPASSGNITRHRLNRGGDRRLNRALHAITLTRMAHHQPTRDYVERRRAEGLTTKAIRRCLKRYLARQIYRTLANPTPA
ncbi:IS110 family transposase [Demequina iriomotensis]|uniref:IS110 family transposase n=1 Tax=Demequina iriomotensis TaxID=1536641 RepID=UPI0007809966|nr:IS110 family transposase [Demequina iriomotensis]